ncbi:MAG: hypothetical protein JWL76_2269 [Thermoleophilia bacterium]|nr:hypothetical protein [Thermoleophilia bacterium]
MTDSADMRRLDEVAEFMGGGTPARADEGYFGGDIPWIKTTDLNNAIIDRTEELLTERGLAESSCKMVPSGAVVVAMYGGFRQIGRTGLLAQASAINQALTAIVPKAGVLDPSYLQEWLNHRVMDWRRVAISSRKDPNITKSDVQAFRIPMVSHDRQLEIVDMLDAWNLAIDLSAQAVHAIDRRNAGLLGRLFRGEIRVAGFEDEWDHVKAGELFSASSSKGDARDELLSVTQDRGVIPRSALEGRVTMPTGSLDTFKLVEPGNFVISLRSFQGGIEYSKVRGLVSPAYTVLQPTSAALPEYFTHYLKSDDFLRRLSVAVIGIRDGRQVSYRDFSSIRIPVPSKKEQIAISQIATSAIREAALARDRVEALRLQKRAVMQRLFVDAATSNSVPAGVAS